MATKQKAVFNLVFDDNVIRHQHPEIGYNQDAITYLSGVVDAANIAISANEIAIDIIEGDVENNTSAIIQLSGDIDYLSAAIDYVSANISASDFTMEINYLSGAIDDLSANVNINSNNISYISGDYVTLSTDQVISANKTIEGDLRIEGTFTALSSVIITTEEFVVSSNFITLNNNVSGVPSEDAGIRVARGTEPDSELRWDETNDRWLLGISGSLQPIVLSGDLTQIINNIDYLSGVIDENTIVIDEIDVDVTLLSAQNIYLSGSIDNLSAEVQYISGEVSSNDNDIDYLSGAIDALSISGIPSGTGISFKSFSIQTDQSGTDYIAGYYDFDSNDANLTQGLATIQFGSTNTSYAAHASIIAGGPGTVDTGTIGLRVNGTSINDAGTRIALDSETVTTDITTLSVNEYLETSKKWLGTITFELFSTSGSPTTYSLNFNYGLSKYEDFGNNNFEVNQLEIVGKSAGNDSGFNVKLFHHNASGWNYSATGFVPGGTEIASLSGSHSPEDDISNSEHFAFKRSNLSTFVNGQTSEGVVISIDTSVAQVIEHMDAHIGVLGLIAGNDVSGITNDIIYLSAAIDNNTTNITNNLGDISNLSAEVQYISGEVASNNFDITYLSGAIDDNSTDILSLSTEVSGHQIFTYSAARNNQNASNIYLRGPNGVPTNQAGFMITFDSTIIAIGATSSNSATWTAEVRKNNLITPETSLNVIASTSGLINNLNINVNEGDELQMYCNGTNINRPHATVYLIRR